MKRAVFLSLAMAWLAASTGCCGGFAARCGCGCGPGSVCDGCVEPAASCGEGCGGGCGGCDATCDRGGCGGCGHGCFRPLAPVAWVVRLLGCSWPCGGCDHESYWGDFYSNMPDRCEPCDCHGNWIGRGRCGCDGGGGCGGGCGCADGYATQTAPVAEQAIVSQQVPQPIAAQHAAVAKSVAKYPARSNAPAAYAAKPVSQSPYATRTTTGRTTTARAPSVDSRSSYYAGGNVPQPRILSVPDRVVKPATVAAEPEDAPAATTAQATRGEWKATR